MGAQSLQNITNTCYNTALGFAAGLAQTSGNFNVTIGSQISVPSLTGSYQLAMGFFCASQCQYWLTGCSNKAIRPGAGIVDCAGTTGAANQALTSTGTNAVQWSNVPVIYCCAIPNINASSGCNVALIPNVAAAAGCSGCFTVVLCNTTAGLAEIQDFCWIQQTATTVCVTTISSSWPGSNIVSGVTLGVGGAGGSIGVVVTNGYALGPVCGKIIFQNTP
jgi:hypothetical protein